MIKFWLISGFLTWLFLIYYSEDISLPEILLVAPMMATGPLVAIMILYNSGGLRRFLRMMGWKDL